MGHSLFWNEECNGSGKQATSHLERRPTALLLWNTKSTSYLEPMFSLSCARVRARHMSWDKKTWSAHKFSFKMFLHIFHTCRYKYRLVLVRCCTQEIVCAHRPWKIEGTLLGAKGQYYILLLRNTKSTKQLDRRPYSIMPIVAEVCRVYRKPERIPIACCCGTYRLRYIWNKGGIQTLGTRPVG